MKSVISSAVFGAATIAQAASIRHGHAHVHSKRAPAAVLEERAPAVNILAAADSTILTAKKILTGLNKVSDHPVSLSETGPFQVELNNKGTQDIIVVSWSGGDQKYGGNCFVSAFQPDITVSIPANKTKTISYDPTANGGPISGGLAALYPGTGLNGAGQVDNTWLEFTFRTDNAFSATDVSRLINMTGNAIDSHNYVNKAARENKSKPGCSSTMKQCSFICPNNAPTCMYGGTLQDCPVGGAGNVASADGKDGGCGGFTQQGGFVEVNFS